MPTTDRYRVIVEIDPIHGRPVVERMVADMNRLPMLHTASQSLTITSATLEVVDPFRQLSEEINRRTDITSYVWHSGGGVMLVRIDDHPGYWLFSESEYGDEWDVGIYADEDTGEHVAFFADMTADQIVNLLNAIPSDGGSGVQK